jgi:hypothetical protein
MTGRDAAPRAAALRDAVSVGELGGVRYVVARAEAGAALVRLGGDGGAVTTPLPFWSERVAIEGWWWRASTRATSCRCGALARAEGRGLRRAGIWAMQGHP